MNPKPVDRIGYIGFRLLEKLACGLGVESRRRLGAWVGRFAYRVLGGRRRLAAENVRRAFPDLGDSDVQSLVLRNFEHLGRVAIEFVSIPTLTEKKIGEVMRLENTEVLDSASSRGRGVLIFGGHFGNWEYTGLAMRAAGYTVSAIAKRISNPLLDRHINRLRTRFGGNNIGHRHAVRPVLKALRRGEMVGFLLDQRAGAREGVRSSFFGHPVSTNQGLALLALKSGAPVVFATAERRGADYVMRFGPIVEPPQGLPRDQAVVAFTRAFDKVLEDAVRRVPEQWFWVHKRWKLPREMMS